VSYKWNFIEFQLLAQSFSSKLFRCQTAAAAAANLMNEIQMNKFNENAKCQGSHVKKVFGFAVLASLCFMLFVCGTFLNA